MSTFFQRKKGGKIIVSNCVSFVFHSVVNTQVIDTEQKDEPQA